MSVPITENNKKSVSSVSVCNERPSSYDRKLIPIQKQESSLAQSADDCLENTDNEGDAGFPNTHYGIQLRKFETDCDSKMQQEEQQTQRNNGSKGIGTESALYSAVPTYDWVFGDQLGKVNTVENEMSNCDRQLCNKKHKRSGSAFASLGYYGSGKVKPAAGNHRRTLSNITTTGSVYNPTVVMVMMNKSTSNKELDGPKTYTRIILEHCKVCLCCYFFFGLFEILALFTHFLLLHNSIKKNYG